MSPLHLFSEKLSISNLFSPASAPHYISISFVNKSFAHTQAYILIQKIKNRTMHIPFDTRSVGYDDHFVVTAAQTGGGNGPLSEPYHYFRGSPPWTQRGFGARQSGAGVGDVLRHLWRIILPVVKRAGAAVGKETLETGGRVLDRVVKGDPVKEAVVSEGKKGIDTLLEKGGMQKQFGGGGRRLRGIKSKRRRPSHQILIGKRALKPATSSSSVSFPSTAIINKNKRKRSDTFGLY
jgi:hypothetical protein